jgi:NADH:ubiquinone oxidoreductase subunit 6 (subunit J)
VLFLFAIMLLNLGRMGSRFELSFRPFAGPRAKLAVAIAVAIGLIGLVTAQRASLPSPGEPPAQPLDDVELVAVELFGRYSLPFQATSVLLLATMVAVVMLAKRQSSRGADTVDASRGRQQERTRRDEEDLAAAREEGAR